MIKRPLPPMTKEETADWARRRQAWHEQVQARPNKYLKASAKVVASSMIWSINRELRLPYVFLSLTTLREKTGQARDTIIEALQALEADRQLLAWKHWNGKRPGVTRCFPLLWENGVKPVNIPDWLNGEYDVALIRVGYGVVATGKGRGTALVQSNLRAECLRAVREKLPDNEDIVLMRLSQVRPGKGARPSE